MTFSLFLIIALLNYSSRHFVVHLALFPSSEVDLLKGESGTNDTADTKSPTVEFKIVSVFMFLFLWESQTSDNSQIWPQKKNLEFENKKGFLIKVRSGCNDAQKSNPVHYDAYPFIKSKHFVNTKSVLVFHFWWIEWFRTWGLWDLFRFCS